ncbi:MAG: redoxin domain-containing protein [Acidobacteriia bacterium]|nr:redoxin domain-containing protein [Terriglobia bacterium]
MRKAVLALAVLVLLSPCALAQDPLEILKKVAATYSALPKTTYDFELVEVREDLGTYHHQSEERMRIAGAFGSYRQETIPSGVLYVSDGQVRWTYNPDRNEYSKFPTNPAAGHASALSQFETAAASVKSARVLRQETLELASGPVACQVIEVEGKSANANDRIQYSPSTYWIDTSRNLVLKQSYRLTITDADRPRPSESITTTTFLKATVGQPVEESLLHFIPPADAVQVERMTFGPKSPLAGKDAPDFALQGVDGQAITRANLRGSVVLLQFDPTANDDDARFRLEMTYRSLKGNGLTAIYILPQRNQPVTGNPGYSVPVATDPGGKAAKAFGIGYKGTVLIDRLGKIAYANTSSGDAVELVFALQKAGVW